MKPKIKNMSEAIGAADGLAAALVGSDIAKCWEGNPLGSCLARNRGVDELALVKSGTLCLPCEAYALSSRLQRSLYKIRKHQVSEGQK